MPNPRKPDTIKKARGTYRPSNGNADAPELDSAIPPMPREVKKDPTARREWNAITKELEAVGIVTKLDASALSGYCLAHSKVVAYKMASDELTLDQQIAKGYDSRLHKWIQERSRQLGRLGLSPSDRASLKVAKQAKTDGIRDFLKKGKAS